MPEEKPSAGDAPRHHVLPVVERICAQIDTIFMRYVGPIAPMLCEECFMRWSSEGDTGPRAVGRYIRLLAGNIPTVGKRATFTEEARVRAMQILKNDQDGKHATPLAQSGVIDLDI